MISYYNPNKAFNVVVDVSNVDVGALLTEEDQVTVVDFACQSLSGLELRYSQTGRESLVII